MKGLGRGRLKSIDFWKVFGACLGRPDGFGGWDFVRIETFQCRTCPYRFWELILWKLSGFWPWKGRIFSTFFVMLVLLLGIRHRRCLIYSFNSISTHAPMHTSFFSFWLGGWVLCLVLCQGSPWHFCLHFIRRFRENVYYFLMLMQMKMLMLMPKRRVIYSGNFFNQPSPGAFPRNVENYFKPKVDYFSQKSAGGQEHCLPHISTSWGS